jgi:23S rRNA (pseudouridine1915-N3)-methyltransferase
MRIIIAAVGRLKAGSEREMADRYRERAVKIGRALGVRSIEVVEVKESRASEAERRRVEEAIALASIVPDGAVTVVLDPRGDNLQSDAFAALLAGRRDSGSETLCFVIGGAEGLGDALRRQAGVVIAFGAATWPHQLVRIMLLEQIYRAFTILAGHPYHRE